MSTDTFGITKLSRAMTGKKRCYSPILRTPWIYGLLSAGIKDNGVFVDGEMNYENRNYSKAGC
ncbi:MAG: hypothetical protein K6E51_03950 [Treponema sp.]|nr:hypothetical protein [Treponema sp.]